MTESSHAPPPPLARPERRTWGVCARQIRLPNGRLLDNGAVWGVGDRIAGVGSPIEARRSTGLDARSGLDDLGDVLLLPGLINAHCHLELTFLRNVIPAGLSFPEWLGQMMPRLRGATSATFREAARQGVDELRRGGCVYIADIVTRLPFPPPFEEFLPSVEFRLFRELIEFDETRAVRAVEEGLEWARDVAHPGLSPGLSPHAPYTTTLPLLTEAAAAARREGLTLCVHCDETPDEHRLWTRGDGPFRDFLAAIHVIADDWRGAGCTPVEWLDRAGILAPPRPGLPGALLVHLNGVEDSDLERMALRGAGAVVCPGTHLYFRRGPFPLERLLRAGIPTALGTDGLSSNDRLSMWEEIRRATQLAPELSAGRAIALATSEAACALGIQDRFGSIEPGKKAAFCVVETPSAAPPLDSAAALDWLHDPGLRIRKALVYA